MLVSEAPPYLQEESVVWKMLLPELSGTWPFCPHGEIREFPLIPQNIRSYAQRQPKVVLALEMPWLWESALFLRFPKPNQINSNIAKVKGEVPCEYFSRS